MKLFTFNGALGNTLLGLICLLGNPGMAQPQQALSEEQQVRARFIDASTEIMREEYDKAMDILEQILEKDPQNAAAHYAVAKVFFTQKALDQALIHARLAIQYDPEIKWYPVLLREVYQEQGAISKAIETQEALVERFPDDWAQQLHLVELYKASQSWEMAKKNLNALQQQQEDNPVLEKLAYEIYLALGDKEQARKHLQTLVEDEPENREYILLLYKLYEEEGNTDGAIGLLKDLLAQDPNNPGALWILAQYDLSQRDTTSFASHILPAFSHEGIPVTRKAELLASLGENVEAPVLAPRQFQQLIDATLVTHAGESGSQRLRGDMFFLKGEYDSSYNAYKAALDIDPADTETWEKMLASAEQAGDYAILYAEAEEALAFFPNQTEILCYYGLASVRESKWTQAAYAFNKLERLPNVAESLRAKYFREWAYMDFLQEQYGSAWERIQQALAWEPHPWGYELSGDILYKQGKKDEARKQWMLAQEHGALNLNIEDKLTQ